MRRSLGSSLYGLIARSCRLERLPAAEKELLRTLLQLAEFIYEQPAMGDVEYTFKHALTLEVGYNSVLAERRRLLHEDAAQARSEEGRNLTCKWP